MSGSAISASALLGLTEPPYWIRIAAAVGCAEPLDEPLADVRVDFLGLRGRRRAAGADRPDRLVRDHEALRGDRAVDAVEAARELRVDDVERAAAVALGEHLADAHDRAEPGRERGARFLADALVRVAEELAALAVTDDRPGRAGVGEQRRRDLAGERAARFPEAVLRAASRSSCPRAASRPRCSAMNVGATPTATPLTAPSWFFSSVTSASASAIVLLSFQLPTTNGVRMRVVLHRRSPCPLTRRPG